ncbi:hypothetical protein C8J45_11618 [Sphingomonas sp. PP-CE-3G-477]|jgi:hypothetical protein|nr:hypothetical protein C8J45_11618 [Sphingomonas sp. PP-CE-3G-477]
MRNYLDFYDLYKSLAIALTLDIFFSVTLLLS